MFKSTKIATQLFLLKNIFRTISLSLSLLLVFSFLKPYPVSGQTATARLSFTPTSQTVASVGRTGTINAFLNPGGTGVGSVELVITFNPSVLTVNNITPGAFFTSSAGTPIEIIKNIDNTAGRIHYAVGFPLASGHTSVAQNTAAVISFTSRGTGTSTFNYVTTGLVSSRVSNINAINILGGATSGSVVVGGTTVTPTRSGTATPTRVASNTPTRSGSNTATPTRRPTATPTRTVTVPPGSTQGAVLSFAPTSQSVSGLNRTGNVNVFLTPNGRNVSSAELVINFNPNIIRVNDISPGAFFTNSGAGSPIIVVKNIDNTAGKIHYAVGFPLGSGHSSTTSNVAAQISFTSKAAGTSSLGFVMSGTTSTKVSDVNANNVLASAGTGSIVVSGGTNTPTPSNRVSRTPTPTTRISPATTISPNMDARLSFNPTSQNISSVGGSGTVNAYLNPNFKNISSVELVINFNPAIIRVDSIAPGAFFTSNAGSPIEVIKNIDNTAGKIHYAVGFPLGSGHSSSAQNVAAVISFTSKATGTSTLAFQTTGTPSTKVSDVNAANVLGTVSSGSIVVGGGTGEICYETDPEATTTPQPTTTPPDDDEEVDDDKKPIITFTANPSSVNPGGSTVITWSTENAVFCNAFGGTSSWPGARGTSGSFTVNNLQRTLEFGLICGSDLGDRSDGNFEDDDRDETVKKIIVRVVSGTGNIVNANEEAVLALTTENKWTNVPMSTLSGNYTVLFSATPKEINDSYVGLSNGPAQYFTDLTSIIHFTHNGTIVARDEIQYTATQIVTYQAGQTYDFKIVVNSVDKTYSAFVTPRGGQTLQIAADYSFRLEQMNTEFVNNLGMFSRSTSGGLKVCSIKVVTSGQATPTPIAATSTPAATVTPTACVPTEGDANGDAAANGADYDIWDANYNQSTLDGPSAGDFDCSKFVDGVDYVIWLIKVLNP